MPLTMSARRNTLAGPRLRGHLPAGNGGSAQATGADGYRGTAPARVFVPNGYSLFQMRGNVREWNADAFRVRSLKRIARALNLTAAREGRHLLKGGSFLCHHCYCFRYRIGNTPDTSTSHAGFRVAHDISGSAR